MSSYIDVVHPERHAPYLDIPDDVVAVGNPCKVIRKNLI